MLNCFRHWNFKLDFLLKIVASFAEFVIFEGKSNSHPSRFSLINLIQEKNQS